MKKITLCFISILSFLFIFSSKVSAQGYNGKLGYEYSSSTTQFFYLNENSNDKTIKLHIDETLDTDMIYDSDSKVWYASVNGDLKGKTYYYEICYGNNTCIEVIDPFANSINVNQDRNVILDANSIYVEGYQDIMFSVFNYYNNSIYAIEADKFVESMVINTEPDNDQEIDEDLEELLPDLDQGEIPQVEFKDSIFNRLTANASYANYATGFNYIVSLQIKNLEVGNLYDSNNYFSANQNFSTKENNYSAINELKNFILKYKNNKMNVISRMDLLTPGEELKQNLLAISSDYVLENGKINLSNEDMKRYILDVYKYWVQEYKIDGFYIIDADSYGSEYLTSIINELKTISSSLFIYTDSTSLGEYYTSDNLQNTLYGSLENINNEGVINGNFTKDSFDKLVNAMFSGYYSDLSKGKESTKVINNIGSLSGVDVYSKLMLISGLGTRESEILNKVKLGLYTIYSSAGIPRLVAGNEFLNTNTISSDEIANTSEDEMLCNTSKTLCYAKGEGKHIDWGYLVRNGSDIRMLMSYRTKYIYQYPNYATMATNSSLNYYQDLAEKGILYLTFEYDATYKGDMEKSIMIINYSDNLIEMDAISDRNYYSVSALLGKLSGDDKTTKIEGYTFYTFTQTKVQKFSNFVYILIALGLLLFIFGVRYLLIWLLKNKKGIDYKTYSKEQKVTKKANKKKKIKENKEPGVFETYLKGDSLIEKITNKIVNPNKKNKKANKKADTETENKKEDEESKKDDKEVNE